MLNQISIMGRLTREPELKTTSAGKSVCTIAQALMDECRINLIIERPDGVSMDIQEIFAAMGKQPWYKLRIRVGGKENGKSV